MNVSVPQGAFRFSILVTDLVIRIDEGTFYTGTKLLERLGRRKFYAGFLTFLNIMGSYTLNFQSVQAFSYDPLI